MSVVVFLLQLQELLDVALSIAAALLGTRVSFLGAASPKGLSPFFSFFSASDSYLEILWAASLKGYGRPSPNPDLFMPSAEDDDGLSGPRRENPPPTTPSPLLK